MISTLLYLYEYLELKRQISEGFPASNSTLPVHLKEFWKLRDELSISHAFILGIRIIIQKGDRKVLRRLHESHQGIDRIKRRAR